MIKKALLISNIALLVSLNGFSQKPTKQNSQFKNIKEVVEFNYGLLKGENLVYLVDYLIDDEVELLSLYMNKIGFPSRETNINKGLSFSGSGYSTVEVLYKERPYVYHDKSIPTLERIVLTHISKTTLYNLISTLLESGKFTKGKSFPSNGVQYSSNDGLSRKFTFYKKIRNHTFSIVTFDYDGKSDFNEIQFMFN
ncbi:MAG: hypothetical protein RL108_1484 [Bacteroidota bacterium]|jgi:hypothetical protein